MPYARYFLARIYQFQFYKAMCDASGYKGPLNRCSFYGSKAAGEKLAKMLEAGQSQPWQETLKEMTGTDHLDAGADARILRALVQVAAGAERQALTRSLEVNHIHRSESLSLTV